MEWNEEFDLREKEVELFSKSVTSMFLHIRESEGNATGMRRSRSWLRPFIITQKKETEFHLLFKIEDVFFNIHRWGTFLIFHFSSKIVGLMGWHSVIFCCSAVARQSDHMIQAHNKPMRWTCHTKTRSLWHLTMSAGTCDASEQKNSWRDGGGWGAGGAYSFSDGWLKYPLPEAPEAAPPPAALTLRCSWAQIFLPSQHSDICSYLVVLKALLLVQTVHERSNNQLWNESPFKGVQVLFDCISPSFSFNTYER